MSLNPYIYNQELIQKAERKTFNKTDSFRVMQKAAEACYNTIIDTISTQKYWLSVDLGIMVGMAF